MKIAIEAQRIFRPNKHGMDLSQLAMNTPPSYTVALA